MRLEAVMENLQRQQTARLALEKKIRQAEAKDLRCLMESQMERQAAALGRYHPAVPGALSAGVLSSLSRGSLLPAELRHAADDHGGETSGPGSGGKGRLLEGDRSGADGGGGGGGGGLEERRQRWFQEERGAPRSDPAILVAARRPESPAGQPQHHEWTFEEQFKQARFAFHPVRCSQMACSLILLEELNNSWWLPTGETTKLHSITLLGSAVECNFKFKMRL